MASVFGHAISALAFSKAFREEIRKPKTAIIGMLSAMLPDVDILSFSFGIPYAHLFGHRGFTHSLFFAALWSFILVTFSKEKNYIKQKFWFFFICTASHGFLDAMTTGGMGIAFFAPFSAERHFLPWRMIKVSPIHVEQFFGEWGISVLYSEAFYIFLPAILFIICCHFWRKFK